MDSPLLFDQIDIGRRWNSPARTITETDVINFASMTGDFNPLHVDFEFATKSPYRRPIAHGLLGLAWVAGLGSRSPWVMTIAFASVREWHFLHPLFFGDTVHVQTTCLDKVSSGRKAGKVVWQHELINQVGQIAQRGTFETLVANASSANHQLHSHWNAAPRVPSNARTEINL